MRAGVMVAATTLLAISCTSGPGPSAIRSLSPSPSVSGSPSPSVPASALPTPIPTSPSGKYGLLLTGQLLEIITTAGGSRAHATVAPPTVRTCAEGLGAVLQPPVSAGKTNVYFRDGDTKIRFLTLGGRTGDVTTVPGGEQKVSFFSVSPDEKRIAVLVEDLSPATTINLRLYVEDLHGGGHRASIYSTSTPKKGGTTLWPMGWHEGNLVLAVIAPCIDAVASGQALPANFGPTEWHVSSASTGGRVATIRRAGCVFSFWPSTGGVACVDAYRSTSYVYNWAGKLKGTVKINRGGGIQSSLSPSGRTVLFSNQAGTGALPSELLKHDGAGETSAMYEVASVGSVSGFLDILCLWMDDDHAIGPQSIFDRSGTRTSLPGGL